MVKLDGYQYASSTTAWVLICTTTTGMVFIYTYYNWIDIYTPLLQLDGYLYATATTGWVLIITTTWVLTFTYYNLIGTNIHLLQSHRH